MKFEPEELGRSVIEPYIEEYIFNERDRNIVKRRLFDAISFEKLAEEFDLNPDYVRKLYSKQSKRIFDKMNRNLSVK